MNGETLDKELLPFKQNKKQLKVLKTKFFVAILLSNLVVYLATDLLHSEPEQVATSNSSFEVPAKDHVLFNIPMEVYVPDLTNHQAQDFVPVSIFSQDKRLLVGHAYLLIKQKTQDEMDLSSNKKTYVISVPAREINKIIGAQSDYFLAYPPTTQAKMEHKTQGPSYELTF